jgi:hypothetical protein
MVTPSPLFQIFDFLYALDLKQKITGTARVKSEIICKMGLIV